MVRPVLSICIATYNHGESLFKKVQDLLAIQNDKIEIVVSDNCSTDKTEQLFSGIDDPRFVFFERKTNEGPVKNYMTALSHASGKYSVFITDKDAVLANQINNVVSLFEELACSVGYFTLDSTSEIIKITRYETKLSSLLNIAYLSKHPTGYFFNTELLKNLDLEGYFSEIKNVSCFPFEFICAELAQNGNTIVVDMPFCITSKIILNSGVVSQTYSAKNNNLFFFPGQRMDVLGKYMRHLDSMNLSRRERREIHEKLVYATFLQCTDVYRKLINDEGICSHYRIDKEHIDNKELRIITLEYIKFLSSTGFSKNIIDRFYSIFILLNYLFITAVREVTGKWIRRSIRIIKKIRVFKIHN